MKKTVQVLLQDPAGARIERRRSRRHLWSPLLGIGCAVLLYLAVAPAGGSALKEPRLAFDDINPRSATFGRTVALDGLYAERGVVLRFIASWCEVCRNELHDLEELRAAHGAPIVFVAADEYGAPDSLLIVAEREALTTPILYVPEERIADVERRFPYETLPATYVIDRGGQVRMEHEGALPLARLTREMETELGI